MTGVREALTIEDAEINAALTRVEEAGGDSSAMMRDVAAAMLFSVQRRFEQEIAPDGSKWPAHAPSTAKARANRKTRGNAPVTPKLLRQTNRLFKSITGESSASEAAVGTNLDYAAIHQQGGTIMQYPQSRKVRFRKVGGQTRFAKKAHKRAVEKPVTFGQRTIVIPARAYLGFSQADRETIQRIAGDHYNAAVSGGQP
ncbi:phage virion morphogenesis protein [Roseibium porphyridii]|uniref:Phage virion morphogenesis protein n=1 Tax=Roseibium porphyridii TaxID=2866279 RepID=A0ABY8FA14_9HYPH|nr:phage virion morphogenesis protein [Roseibium sp. KMA01]WFE92302.1 phage virion morphogenesis protein [Roseibium sp. KMA01]